MKRPAFSLDRRDRKLIGVCAGIGRSLNVDPTFVRIAFVAVPLLTFVTVWQALLAYFICGLVGAAAMSKLKGRRSDYERMGEAPRASVKDLREKLDTTDRRMMAIDHHINNSESDALAREIEALRTEKA
ncbi:PspC domain-containing protein [Sphingomonas glaciei]|uniref:PspC domain-containing protein n=1 Tax=Sphingomonas glaciei TaxID=2938948 RepID=A0ABY5MZ91_9SPHN|nr:PspC domain-containing protein [Sphingomonas glaciei]UUR09116.1 PspC domain-containing protein [Sphingomonas glaciei]